MASKIAKFISRAPRPAKLAFVAIFSLAATFGLDRLGWLVSMENVYYDYWHQFAGVRRDASHTAVIAVDDETLVKLKDDPLAFWAPYFAQAMESLAQAGTKVIGLDFIYTVSAEAWLKKLNLPDSEISRNYDSPLREQFAKGDKVLISHLVEAAGGDLELLIPPDDQLILLPRGPGDTGVANLYPDNDKLVRHYYPIFMPGHPAGVGFATQLALRAAGVDPAAEKWVIGGEEIPRDLTLRRIGYVGPPGTILTVSMSKLLEPDALNDPKVQALKGRAVIIAANNAGTSDRHFTPYSRGIFGWTSDQMIGGEIHANIIETLLSGTRPRSLPIWIHWLYVGLIIFFASRYFLRLDAARGLLLAVVVGEVVLIPSYYLFLNDWVLPVAQVHGGLAFAYLATLGMRLTGEEREREGLMLMFGRYVSEDVVDTLLSEEDRPDLAGEERHVTVLFSDIRNFTTISEKLSAHEVVRMLNAYFSLVCEPILNRGGMVNKYIGDAVMAVFGAPKSFPDHPRRAIAAALEMAKEADNFRAWMNEHFGDRGLPEFAVGIGLHTGTCVIGDIGSARRTEFTAIGDTVNAASRLEGMTKELKCVLIASKATVDLAGPGVRTGKQEIVYVKGRAEPLEVFEILGLDDEPLSSTTST